MSSAADTVVSGATGTTTGADELVRALRLLGVDTVFGLPGVHNLAVEEAAAHGGLRVVGVRKGRTVAVADDGGLLACGELATVAQERLPLTAGVGLGVVVDAGLIPPPSTSPRWYRRGGDGA